MPKPSFFRSDSDAMAATLETADVTWYSYRQARVVGEHVVVLPRTCLAAFERALATRVGIPTDNHTVFVGSCARLGAPNEWAIWFHDDRAYVGLPSDVDANPY